MSFALFLTIFLLIFLKIILIFISHNFSHYSKFSISKLFHAYCFYCVLNHFYFFRYITENKLVVVKENIVSEVHVELIPVKEKPSTVSSTTSIPISSTSTKAISTANLQTSTTTTPAVNNKETTKSELEFKHHHYKDMVSVLQNVTKKCPKITRLYSIGKSVEGRDLFVLEMTDNPGVHEPGRLRNSFILLVYLLILHFLCLYDMDKLIKFLILSLFVLHFFLHNTFLL